MRRDVRAKAEGTCAEQPHFQSSIRNWNDVGRRAGL
jgi:hypothetical protein